MKFIVHNGWKTLDTLKWVRWAEVDYLAARILLLSELLVQGATLANTALEKYMKAVLCESGASVFHGHDLEALYSAVKGQAIGKNLNLKNGFLKLLGNAYTLRYPDDLGDGFNIVLNQAMLLSELDRSVLEITSCLQVDLRGETQKMVLDKARPGNDARYFEKNVATDNEMAGNFFGGKSACYEIRCDRKYYVEAIYSTEGVQDDRAFDKAGLSQVPGEEHTFTVTYKYT